MSDPARLDEVLKAGAALLRAGGSETPDLDARVLLGECLEVAPLRLIVDKDLPVPTQAYRRFEAMILRRLAGEPVARIVGKREFWSLAFELAPSSLVPRPDSETLVAAALELLPRARSQAVDLLDLGTGPGTLLLPLLHEWKLAHGLGVDRDEATLRAAQRNAKRFGLAERARFICGDWGGGLAPHSFDLVVSNPPYIRSGDIPHLSAEVRLFDPLAALDGGRDGLHAYRLLLPQVGTVLKPGGLVLLEIGEDQEIEVSVLAAAAGFTLLGPARRDLAGCPRVIAARPGPR